MDGGKKHLFLVNISSHSQLIGPTKAPTVWGSKYTLSTEYTSSMRGQRLVKRKQLQRDIKFWVVKKKPTGLMVFQRAPLSYEMMPNSLVSDPTCSKIMYTSAHNVTNCHLSLHLFRGLKKHTHTNILTLNCYSDNQISDRPFVTVFFTATKPPIGLWLRNITVVIDLALYFNLTHSLALYRLQRTHFGGFVGRKS